MNFWTYTHNKLFFKKYPDKHLEIKQTNQGNQANPSKSKYGF